MGMEHKLEAYCNHLRWNLPAGSIYLDTAAIVLALVEFTLGVYLLLGMRKRLTAIGTFVFMLVMTVVTIYIYLYSPVPDCGCFGDAILLTNGQTLAKNIVLLACAVLLLFAGQHSLRIISKHTQWLLSLYALVYMIGVALYSLHYLPLVDFTGYDLGTKVEEAMRGEEDMTFVYEKNGKQQTFRMENLPDSTWKYVRTDTKVIRPATIKDFSFVDSRTQQEIGDVGRHGQCIYCHDPQSCSGRRGVFRCAERHLRLCTRPPHAFPLCHCHNGQGRFELDRQNRSSLSFCCQLGRDARSLGARQSGAGADPRRANRGEMEQQ